MRNYEKVLIVRQHQARRRSTVVRQLRGWRGASLVLLAMVSTLIAFGLIGFGWIYTQITSDLPAVDELALLLDPQHGALLQPTRLYDRSGQKLIYTLENPGIPRRALPLDPAREEAISPVLIQTVLALQDPDFLTQPMLRLDDLNNPRPGTLTEKLIDELLLSDEKPGLRKTLRLRVLADQTLTRFGRLQILEWYLNNASFGHLAYGADAAAQLYLGKPASHLDLAEAALLAAVLDAPALNPLDSPAAALERQQEALRQLLAAGIINPAQYTQAVSERLALRSAAPQPQSPALAFSIMVIDQLAVRIGRQRLEYGGLSVITSLDFDLQVQLNCTLRVQLGRLSAIEGSLDESQDCQASRLLPAVPLDSVPAITSSPLTSSAVILDAQSGQVLALAGDSTLAGGEDPLLKSHSAGSLQTPFLALGAFARSLNPASLVWDVPSDGNANPDGKYLGPLRLRSALVNHRLAALGSVLQQIGPENMVNTARSLGLTSLKLIDSTGEVLSSGGNADPLEAAYAVSAFANLGTLNGLLEAQTNQLGPVLTLRVENAAGSVLLSDETSQNRQVVSAQLAYLVHDVLSDEPARWPSLGYPNALEIGRPAGALAAGTSDGSSTWAAGYTRQRVVLVWLGLEDGASVENLDLRLVAGLWHALIQYASRDLPIENWNMPSGLVSLDVCDPSGLLPTAVCPNVVSEIFLEGSQPVSTDTLYRSFQINRETGRLATIFTPAELVEERTYLDVPPEAQEWASQAGLPLPPLDYDVIQAPPPNPDAQITSPASFSAVRGKVSIRGSAGGEGFLSYSLQVGQGINPSTWVTVGEKGTSPVTNANLAEWDTTDLEGLYVVRLLVVHTGQRIETALLQVTVDNTPPVIRLSYPKAGQEFDRSQQLTITLPVEVEDALGVQRVEWWLDGRKIGERCQAPYALLWYATEGSHTLQVHAWDTAGNESRSEEIKFTVR